MPDLTTKTGWQNAAAAPERRLQAPARPLQYLRALDRLAAVFVLAIAIPLIYWPSAEALNGYWTDTVDHTYTHGYLVLLTSLWLVWRARKPLAAASVQPARFGWILVLTLSTVWVWSWRAAIQDAHLLLLPLLLLAAVAVMLGWRAARVLLFPIGFLYFAMPVWSDINGILQLMSYKVGGGLLWLTGIPAYLQGDLIQLPAGTLEIAEGCSGLHFFIVGLTLAALYGELSEDSLLRRAAWYAILGAIALIANWVRIYVIGVVAYLSDMHSSLVPHHYWFGWVVFVVGFLAFLWLAGKLADAWDRGRPAAAAPEEVRAPAVAETRAGLARLALTLLCLAVLPGLSYGMDLKWPASAADVGINWAAVPAGWRGPMPVLWSEWAPVYRHATVQAQRRYLDPAGQAVEVYAAVYRTQRQGAKLLGYWNSLLGAEGRLRRLSQSVVRSPSGKWLQTTAVDPAGMRSLIWSRYRIGQRVFVDARLSQFWYGIAALTSRPVSSLTAFRAVCRRGCATARAQLAAATTGLEPALRLGGAEGEGSAP